MRSPRAALPITALALALVAGCDRYEPESPVAVQRGGTIAGAVTNPEIMPGPARPSSPGGTNPYTGNVEAVAEGERLYGWYNCADCHGSRGGGGMGPPLRDETWIYGGDAVSIYRSIVEGRPNGMPTWGHVLPEDQVWRIVAFIEAMGGEFEGEPVLSPPAGRANSNE